MIQFPITDVADQQFGAVLNNRRVTLRIRYNVTTDRWSFNLSIDDTPVLHGRRVVQGVDLLAAFNFGIGAIFAFADNEGAEANRDNLPSGVVRLYHATAAEIEAATA